MRSLPCLAFAATAALCGSLATPAHAEGSATGLRARLWLGAVGRYLLKDNEDFESPPIGTVSLAIDGSAVAVGGGFEYKPFRWLGVEASLAFAEAPVRFSSSQDPGVTQHDTFRIVPIYVGVNLHVLNTKRLDLWFGPQLSYEIHPDDLSFAVNGGDRFEYKSSNPFSYIGFSVGADISIDERMAINLGFRWEDADGDADGHLTYDPTFITAGLTAKL